MDYGTWRSEEERKARASRKNQVHVSFKEVRLRPKIGEHDYEWLEVETDPANEVQARELAEKSEQTCLVSASLDLPVETVIEVKRG
jgi:organic hydroperoxide reductase OsmC/OhrA